MNLHVLVMAQGKQQRLPAIRYSKHLLEVGGVGGEPILGRTLRLIAELAPAAHVTVIGWPDQTWVCAARGVELVGLVNLGYCVVDGIAETAVECWRDGARIIILLGDVVFSRAALRSILEERRPLVFAGTSNVSASQGEIYAAAWDDHDAAFELLNTCPCRKAPRATTPRRFSQPQGGHLRRLLWWAQETKHLKPPVRQFTWHPDLYLPIDDWTDDIDTPADVAHLPELAEYARREERTDNRMREEREARQFARE